MADPGSEASAFESRLEAMDRRLRELQEELAPTGGAGGGVGGWEKASEPARLRAAPEASTPSLGTPAAAHSAPAPSPPVAAAPAPSPAAPPISPAPPPVAPTPQLAVLAQLYGKLVASVRELLDGYELVAGQLAGPGRPDEPPREAAAEPASRGSAQVAVSAGPFAGTRALRDFERALSELPGVRGVSLRGYDAGDRAVVDVELL